LVVETQTSNDAVTMASSIHPSRVVLIVDEGHTGGPTCLHAKELRDGAAITVTGQGGPTTAVERPL
jgi:hypothetical protein